MENKKVLIGMSGGVDSSVAALLLKNQGYEVVGATLELFDSGKCGNTAAYVDAKKICDQLEIEHVIMDYKEEFKKRVIDDFINCYANCLTPNPCIECNKFLKFGVMWQRAKELGCNYLATGHYAKTEYSDKYGKWVLKKSDSIRKDQSYVLWNMPKDLVEHVIFPLSNFEEKNEIRKIAQDNNLQVANKPDSEDICFIPDGDYKKFLEEHSNIKPRPGDIVLKNGIVVGKHEGLYHYTIGQRKGLRIAYSEPLFVLGFNVLKNQVIVGTKEELYTTKFKVKDINLILFDEIKESIEVNVKTRYSAKEAKATIKQVGDIIEVEFDEPQKAVTPGQSAVFYIDDIVVGGGKIM